ncbi:uncharacterized protein BDR25DRAFT_306056 [Lindgomyces ingoldianus]|uniref:Uncharacterized protein n=1 Tax=Lindgomyces ingoldianus TaxID=673940 RepID=A0ACB6QK52_9PLEO|nr:uncharacterized protein BDR25DRAFT_306056 [Lindgomyces ingoldianus]KAF2466506.1 hypothetical protein BDR25DRAFT_306056 [Lindgomyces ingoldianus]
MVAFTTIAFSAAALLGFASAAPNTPPSTGVIHRIFAGSTVANKGLHFEPENIVAEIGDLIEVHFLPKNHSFVQSSFDKPCEPINDNAVFSGFQFNTMAGEAPNVFTFPVLDKKPFWFYCSQTAGNHCQMGMSGVINQNFDGAATLTAYKAKAALTGPSISGKIPSNGGRVLPNKPL